MPRHVLSQKSVRVGLDGPEVVLIVDGDAFLKIPPSAARQVAEAILRNCDLAEHGQIIPNGPRKPLILGA